MRELKPEAVWLAASDIAERLKISRSAAYAIMRRLPRYREGRITRVSEEAFAAYLAANMIAPGAVDARTLKRRRQASIAALADHERLRADAAAKVKKKAAPRAVGPPCSRLNESTVERLTRPTRPRQTRSAR